MTEIPKERIQELLKFKKEYEDEPETEKCLEELLAYKETMAGIARMLGVTRYDITNKNEELLEVNLNNDVIKNALDRYRSFENTFLNKVTVMALKELLEYRETKLAPDQVNEMKSKFEHYKDAYCDIQERYNRLLNYEMEEQRNDRVIKNQIRLSKMFAGSEAVSTKALKELLEYKETGLTPQDIKEMDKMYLEKCKEVNALVKTCERLEKEKR